MTSFFKDKNKLHRSEFRKALRKADRSSLIKPKDRRRIENDIFKYSKYGSKISKREIREVVRKLKSKRYDVGSQEKRRKIDKEVEMLERIIK